MTTDRVNKLLDKRKTIEKQINESHEVIKEMQKRIHDLYLKIEKIDLEIYHGEKGYL